MIIDGKKIAEEIIAGLAQMRGHMPHDLRLGIVMSEGDKATESFVRIKERVANRLNVTLVKEVLPQSANTQQALQVLKKLSESVSGIIVQLPLPADIDTEAVLSAIPENKDIDFINPPVGEAIAEVLLRARVEVKDKKAVVVGAGKLVGAPAAELLKTLRANVEVITSQEGSLTALKEADIVVLGAGSPGMIKPDMLKRGVVLLDAGTSEAQGKVAGDADPACADVASIFTPVPGGIGPIAVAMIFKNLFVLAK